jgi:lysozyme
MRYSQQGINLTKRFEADRGCPLLAYWDGIGKVWTIGYGATGESITHGTRWTQEQADADLAFRLAHIADVVSGLLTVPVTQGEFDSLCDFCYNCGIGALRHSTLLIDVNDGNLAAAAAEFEKWSHAGGKVIAGLLRRRIAERDEFLAGQAILNTSKS